MDAGSKSSGLHLFFGAGGSWRWRFTPSFKIREISYIVFSGAFRPSALVFVKSNH